MYDKLGFYPRGKGIMEDKKYATIDASWYERDPDIPLRKTAGGVVVRKNKDQYHLALVREGDLPTFVLPKGGIDPGETALEAARRETLEEAGFSDLTSLGELAYAYRQNYVKTRWVETLYFLFLTEEEQGFPTETAREYQQVWCSLESPGPFFWPEQKKLIVDFNQEILRRLNSYFKA